jgi:hypothetical protein
LNGATRDSAAAPFTKLHRVVAQDLAADISVYYRATGEHTIDSRRDALIVLKYKVVFAKCLAASSPTMQVRFDGAASLYGASVSVLADGSGKSALRVRWTASSGKGMRNQCERT